MANEVEQLSDWEARQSYMQDKADSAIFESLVSASVAVGGLAYYRISGRKRGAVIAAAGVAIAINRFNAFNDYEEKAEVAGTTHMSVVNMMQDQETVKPIVT